MTSHPHRDNHDEHGHAHLDLLNTIELAQVRDRAAIFEDLALVLRADNILEDRREGAQISAGRRRTCRACSDWADHVHDPLTGERMDFGGLRRRCFTRADVAAMADIAAQVFALAASAPPGRWRELADGSHLITVTREATRFDIRVPTDTDGQASPAYIEDYRGDLENALPMPPMYANSTVATVIAQARRHLTPRPRR